MPHPLFSIIKQIDKTHQGAGRVAVANLLAVKACKAMITVAVPGTGKTTSLNWAAAQHPKGEIRMDSITRSGLQGMDKDLSGFAGVLSVADLGSVDTGYSVKEATKVIALLTHEHRINKRNVSIEVDITDFAGAALSTIQPASMNRLIGGADWESVMQDKIVRYYHLLRPTKIRNDPIEVGAKWGIELNEVSISPKLVNTCKKQVDSSVQQWSDSRAVQHWVDFYRASAALAGRKSVQVADVNAAHNVLRPLNLEPYLILRESLSSDRTFLADDMCFLTELATYGRLDHVRAIKNYRVSTRTLQRTIDRAATWLVPGLRGKREHHPSEQAHAVLADAGYHLRPVV